MKCFLFSCWLALVGLVSQSVLAEVTSQTNVFHFRTPLPGNYHIEAEENLRLMRSSGKVDWLKALPEKGSTNFVEFGSRVVVQLKVPGDLQKLVAGRPLQLSRTITANTFIFQAPDALTAAREAHRLAKLPEVSASYPVIRQAADLNGRYATQPTDFFFAHPSYPQWNLEHRNADGSSAGIDLNVRAAWPFSTGQGVTIGVADIGVELAHPELASSGSPMLHFNFYDQTTNGGAKLLTPIGAHGTEAAGVALAPMNNLRMVGVAPGAQFASWVIFNTNQALASDEHLMDMYQYGSNVVGVQNHSWGHTGLLLGGATLLEQIGLSNAWTFGRFGRGTIMVRAAGNDRNLGASANDDAYPSDPHVIAATAIQISGRAASYSEPGSCILVGAPSGDSGLVGLVSADLLGANGENQISFSPPLEDLSGYVFGTFGNGNFSGTSAAAPQIAGIVALMLSVNTNLTIRDVQQILILASRHFDFADPDLGTNGAGFLVSHNAGFGVPDAGQAVRLAQSWPNRPLQTIVTVTATNISAIPDDGLRLVISGDNIPTNLVSIRTLPSSGPHADVSTANLPLVDVGYGSTISVNLTNKAAIAQRGGGSAFVTKINNAAAAGAAFAVIYNFPVGAGGGAPGGDQLLLMGSTDYVPIPAVFIGNTDGTNLVNLFLTNSTALAQIKLNTTNYTFNITNTLVCEHVGVRVKTDHPLRGDLRITLVSPQGTRSVLQHYNADISAGPVDWTYYSTHHFFESSAGTWTVYFSDEYIGNTGSVQEVSLTIYGTQITDTDHDGLDDNWEISHFGNLSKGPRDDSDHDGYSNAREQVMGTDPAIADVPFVADLSLWNQSLARLSWPGVSGKTYQVWNTTNLSMPFLLLTNVSGQFPETELFLPCKTFAGQFFRISTTNSP